MASDSTADHLELKCRCGTAFMFTENEQELFRNRNFADPKRCFNCRLLKKLSALERGRSKPCPSSDSRSALNATQNKQTVQIKLQDKQMHKGNHGNLSRSTEICRDFRNYGACQYGDRCRFTHVSQPMQNNFGGISGSEAGSSDNSSGKSPSSDIDQNGVQPIFTPRISRQSKKLRFLKKRIQGIDNIELDQGSYSWDSGASTMTYDASEIPASYTINDPYSYAYCYPVSNSVVPAWNAYTYQPHMYGGAYYSRQPCFYGQSSVELPAYAYAALRSSHNNASQPTQPIVLVKAITKQFLGASANISADNSENVPPNKIAASLGHEESICAIATEAMPLVPNEV